MSLYKIRRDIAGPDGRTWSQWLYAYEPIKKVFAWCDNQIDGFAFTTQVKAEEVRSDIYHHDHNELVTHHFVQKV